MLSCVEKMYIFEIYVKYIKRFWKLKLQQKFDITGEQATAEESGSISFYSISHANMPIAYQNSGF